MSEDRASPRDAAAAAALVFALVAPATYLAIRVLERVRAGALDVALIVYERTTGFYWRCGVALWFAAVVAAAAHALLSRRRAAPGRAARWLGPGAIVFVLLYALFAHWFA